MPGSRRAQRACAKGQRKRKQDATATAASQEGLVQGSFLDRLAKAVKPDSAPSVHKLAAFVEERKAADSAEEQAPKRTRSGIKRTATITATITLLAMALWAATQATDAAVRKADIFPKVALTIGAVDVCVDFLATAAKSTLVAVPSIAIKCSSWVMEWGHYPVHNGHLFGHPKFTGPDHVAQAYDKPKGFDGWPGVDEEGLAFTGWVHASCLLLGSMFFLKNIPFTDLLKQAGHPKLCRQPKPGRKYGGGIACQADEKAAYLQFIEAVKKGWVVNLVMTRIGSNTVVAEAKKDPRLQVETVQVEVVYGVNVCASLITGICKLDKDAPCDVALVIHGTHLCCLTYVTAIEALAADMTVLASLWDNKPIDDTLFDGFLADFKEMRRAKRDVKAYFEDFNAWYESVVAKHGLDANAKANIDQQLEQIRKKADDAGHEPRDSQLYKTVTGCLGGFARAERVAEAFALIGEETRGAIGLDNTRLAVLEEAAAAGDTWLANLVYDDIQAMHKEYSAEGGAKGGIARAKRVAKAFALIGEETRGAIGLDNTRLAVLEEAAAAGDTWLANLVYDDIQAMHKEYCAEGGIARAKRVTKAFALIGEETRGAIGLDNTRLAVLEEAAAAGDTWLANLVYDDIQAMHKEYCAEGGIARAKRVAKAFALIGEETRGAIGLDNTRLAVLEEAAAAGDTWLANLVYDDIQAMHKEYCAEGGIARAKRVTKAFALIGEETRGAIGLDNTRLAVLEEAAAAGDTWLANLVYDDIQAMHKEYCAEGGIARAKRVAKAFALIGEETRGAIGLDNTRLAVLEEAAAAGDTWLANLVYDDIQAMHKEYSAEGGIARAKRVTKAFALIGEETRGAIGLDNTRLALLEKAAAAGDTWLVNAIYDGIMAWHKEYSVKRGLVVAERNADAFALLGRNMRGAVGMKRAKRDAMVEAATAGDLLLAELIYADIIARHKKCCSAGGRASGKIMREAKVAASQPGETVYRGVTHMRSSHQSNFYLYGDHKTAVYKDPVSAAVAVDLFNIVYLRAAVIDTLNFSIAGYRKSDKVFEFLDTAIAAAPRFHKPSFATRDELAGWLKSVDTPTLGSAPSDIVDAVSVPEILQKSAKKPCRHSSRRSGS